MVSPFYLAASAFDEFLKAGDLGVKARFREGLILFPLQFQVDLEVVARLKMVLFQQ